MKCENCGIDHDRSYGSGRFCSSKCARGFSTKNKRKEINEQVSLKLYEINSIKYPKIQTICPNCGVEFYKTFKHRNQICCSVSCAQLYLNKSGEYKNKLSRAQKIKCSLPEERKRLRDIGRKGGFGKKGYTNKGIYFQSSFEEKCFIWLDEKNIKYTPHKILPDGIKVSDIYLDDLDLWIELDGIDREKKKKYLKENYQYWLNKLEVYKKFNLNYEIHKTFESFIARLT